jgi:cation transport regulator ChaB
VPKEDLKDLPGTIRRSPRKAQETYAKTLESAHEQYGGDEERAHRAAYASLKHSFEKVGDHWEPKDQKGPSAKGGQSTNPETATIIQRATKAARQADMPVSVQAVPGHPGSATAEACSLPAQHRDHGVQFVSAPFDVDDTSVLQAHDSP